MTSTIKKINDNEIVITNAIVIGKPSKVLINKTTKREYVLINCEVNIVDTSSGETKKIIVNGQRSTAKEIPSVNSMVTLYGTTSEDERGKKYFYEISNSTESSIDEQNFLFQ